MASPSLGLAIKWHTSIFPVLLVVLGCYNFLIRRGITCTASGVNSNILDKTCREGPLYSVTSLSGQDYDSDKHPIGRVSWQASFGLVALTLVVWAWIFYSVGHCSKSLEGNLVKSLQENQSVTQELVGVKCRLYLVKYISIDILAILQLIVFLQTTSMSATGKGFSSSTWVSIARGEEVLPRNAKCVFHKYGPSGTVQLHDAVCHLDFNKQIEMIYLYCVVFAIISLVHMVIDVFYCIAVSNVKILQVLHLCVFGTYTWTEAVECLGPLEHFSGRWMVINKVKSQEPGHSQNSLVEMYGKPEEREQTINSRGQYNRM